MDIVDELKYSASDERANKTNPSKIKIEGNVRNGLASYKSAIFYYKNFLEELDAQGGVLVSDEIQGINTVDDRAELNQQRFAFERDMQSALRRDITSLESNLKIIDDGAERAVDSGLIDITCEDNESIVVVELKAGKADSRSIGQILGYMGDMQEEEERPVRSVLVAHDFDKRAKAAARVIPALTLKRYAIEFRFETEK